MLQGTRDEDGQAYCNYNRLEVLLDSLYYDVLPLHKNSISEVPVVIVLAHVQSVTYLFWEQTAHDALSEGTQIAVL